jgi:hypothetical protein
MKPRVLIFDENNDLSITLKEILDERGYEVFTFSNPGVCPLFHSVLMASDYSSYVGEYRFQTRFH